MDCFLYFQSGAAGHSQYDAVLQTLDVGIHDADAHGVAGLAATGEVLSHCFVFMHVSYGCYSLSQNTEALGCIVGCFLFV